MDPLLSAAVHQFSMDGWMDGRTDGEQPLNIGYNSVALACVRRVCGVIDPLYDDGQLQEQQQCHNNSSDRAIFGLLSNTNTRQLLWVTLSVRLCCRRMHFIELNFGKRSGWYIRVS
jgi:hypothetical protein